MFAQTVSTTFRFIESELVTKGDSSEFRPNSRNDRLAATAWEQTIKKQGTSDKSQEPEKVSRFDHRFSVMSE